jgi:hypothetical protein
MSRPAAGDTWLEGFEAAGATVTSVKRTAEMERTALAGPELLRAQWAREWPEAWRDLARRADLIDRHAWLHATSVEAARSAAGTVDALHEAASAAWLAERVARDEFGDAVVGPFAPVVGAPGPPAVRAERSRPGWRLRGAASRVDWSSTPRRLVVTGIDEGDNAIVALVDVSAAGVSIDLVEGRTASVRLDDVAVPEPMLAHPVDAGAALCDRLVVLALRALVHEIGGGRTSEAAEAEVGLCRAAVDAAGRSANGGRPLARRHDVSAAAVVVLLTCARLGVDARDVGDLAWHRERLAPLL